MSEELKALRNIESKLDQLLKWTRFAGMQQLRTIISQNLTTDAEMLVFELSDGERTTREVARLAGIGSNSTVAGYWGKWSKLGILEPSQKRQGRFQRICSLQEVGLTVPPWSQSGATLEQTEQTKEEVTDERQE